MARAATSRAALMREAQAAIRAAKDEHKRAALALSRFKRQIPALVAARRKVLLLELKRHRQNVLHSVDTRRQAIAKARAALADYQAQQRADLKRHQQEVTRAQRAYRAHLARLAAIRAGKVEEAARHLRNAKGAAPAASRSTVKARAAAKERASEVWDEVRANLEGNYLALAAIDTAAARRSWTLAVGGLARLSKSAKAHRLAEFIAESVANDPEAERVLAERADRAGEELARLAAAEQAAEEPEITPRGKKFLAAVKAAKKKIAAYAAGEIPEDDLLPYMVKATNLQDHHWQSEGMLRDLWAAKEAAWETRSQGRRAESARLRGELREESRQRGGFENELRIAAAGRHRGPVPF